MRKPTVILTVLLGLFFLGTATGHCGPAAGQIKQVKPKKTENPADFGPGPAYNRGVDFYLKKDYNKAIKYFQQALNSEKKGVEQWASYNLGDAYYRSAQKLEKKDPGQAQSLYQNSLEFFRRAMDLNKYDMDAKHNFELTLAKIKKMKAMEKKQKKEQKKHGKGKQEKQKSGQSSAQQKKQQSTASAAGQNKNQQKQKNKQQTAAQKKQSSAENSGTKQKNGQNQQSGQSFKSRPMSKAEAERLLDNFERSEKQQQQLRLKNKKTRQSEVDKYW